MNEKPNVFEISLSVKARLTVLYFTIFGVTLLVFSILLFRAFTKNHQEAFDIALYNYSIDIAHSLEIDFFGAVDVSSDILKEAEKIFPFSLGESVIQLKTLTGKTVATSSRFANKALPFNKVEVLSLYKKKNFILHTYSGIDLALAPKKHYRVINTLIDRPGPDDFVLQVAVPMALLDQEEQGLMTFFLIFIPLSLVLAGFAGYFLSVRAFKPVTTMIANAKNISAHELSKRIPIPHTKDEIYKLAITLNSLLDRLEQAFKSQESFIANASHQLKTPLSIMRGELDLLQKSMAKSNSYSPTDIATIGSLSQEIDHLSRLVEELLLLARVDAGGAALTIGEIRLDELLLETTSRLEKIAALKEIRLSLNLIGDESNNKLFVYACDSDLIRSMFENIIENAIKYSPKDSLVSIEVIDSSKEITVSISDEGPGFNEQDQDKIFQRFFRNNQQNLPGAGLGLAISKKIAEVHGGNIVLESNTKTGSKFIIFLQKMT